MKKKENIVIIVALIIMVIAIIGVSYAAFNYSGLGSKVNTITTGAIKMTYTEDDNIISMSGALPTTDKTGKVRLNPGEYFDFTVSSEITGNVNINYEISAKDVTTSDRKIDGSNIKLYLTRLTDDGEEELMTPETYNEESSANNFTGRPAGEMSLYTSSMNSSETNNYRLRMYVDESYNPQGDGGNLEFSVQVNVYGRDRSADEVSNVLLSNIPEANLYDDGIDTFITGEDPNNYIWYSGKLWRAVSVNNEAKTTKLVTQWNISTTSYNYSEQIDFEGSYMEDWLNDTSVDGFLGNLREPDKFIVTDAKWDATLDATSLGSITRPNGTTAVTDSVGLLNIYEYQMASKGYISEGNWSTMVSNGYLNNGLSWWTLTPNSAYYHAYYVRCVGNSGTGGTCYPSSMDGIGIRPSINLKSAVKIVDGNGTANNPYRLEGDNDINLSGTLLSTRYSGEYVKFGIGENTLYRIVSHENGTGTKITSAIPLSESESFVRMAFGNSSSEDNYSLNSVIGTFLNGEYLTSYVDSTYSNMIEDNTTWYLGTIRSSSYKTAKYSDETATTLTDNTTTAKVGLLRLGELMAGEFYDATKYYNTSNSSTYALAAYWTLTPSGVMRLSQYSGSVDGVHYVGPHSDPLSYSPRSSYGIKPALNLKSNVVITSGDGTKECPFTLALQ